MKRIKRMFFKLFLTKSERVVIWNALWFSNHTYRRRGDIDGAVAVSMVMQKMKYLLGVKAKKYTEEEINQIIAKVVFDNFVKKGLSQNSVNPVTRGTDGVIMVVRKPVFPDCEKCDNENCSYHCEKKNEDNNAPDENKEVGDNSKEDTAENTSDEK